MEGIGSGKDDILEQPYISPSLLMSLSRKCGKVLLAHTRSTDVVAGCSNCFSHVPNFSSSMPSLPVVRLLTLRRWGRRESLRVSSMSRRRPSYKPSRALSYRSVGG